MSRACRCAVTAVVREGAVVDQVGFRLWRRAACEHRHGAQQRWCMFKPVEEFTDWQCCQSVRQRNTSAPASSAPRGREEVTQGVQRELRGSLQPQIGAPQPLQFGFFTGGGGLYRLKRVYKRTSYTTTDKNGPTP